MRTIVAMLIFTMLAGCTGSEEPHSTSIQLGLGTFDYCNHNCSVSLQVTTTPTNITMENTTIPSLRQMVYMSSDNHSHAVFGTGGFLLELGVTGREGDVLGALASHILMRYDDFFSDGWSWFDHHVNLTRQGTTHELDINGELFSFDLADGAWPPQHISYQNLTLTRDAHRGERTPFFSVHSDFLAKAEQVDRAPEINQWAPLSMEDALLQLTVQSPDFALMQLGDWHVVSTDIHRAPATDIYGWNLVIQERTNCTTLEAKGTAVEGAVVWRAETSNECNLELPTDIRTTHLDSLLELRALRAPQMSPSTISWNWPNAHDVTYGGSTYADGWFLHEDTRHLSAFAGPRYAYLVLD